MSSFCDFCASGMYFSRIARCVGQDHYIPAPTLISSQYI